MGRTVFQVLALVAEWERDSIVDRTRNGRLQRYREGCWAGGKPLYGYAYDKETKKLIVNKEECRVVERVFREYNCGKSLGSIADALNDDRTPPRSQHGKGWRADAVRHILLNPGYTGRQVLNRHRHISDIAKVDMKKAIIVDVPKIISEEDWQLAQKHLVTNKRVHPVRKNKWLLQGMVTCGLCGMSFKTESQSSQPKLRYYSCRGRLKQHHLDGTPRCTSPRHNAAWLEDQVWQKMRTTLDDPDELLRLLKETVESLKSREEGLRAKLLPVDERLSELAEQKAKLADDWVIDNMSAERFRELQKSLDSEETRLRSVRAAHDPVQIRELDITRAWLQHWRKQVGAMAWNTEEEDGRTIRLVDGPHKTALQLAELEDENLSETAQFPTTRRGFLQKLQVQVVVLQDRAEINAVIPIEPIAHQEYTST